MEVAQTILLSLKRNLYVFESNLNIFAFNVVLNYPIFCFRMYMFILLIYLYLCVSFFTEGRQREPNSVTQRRALFF